MTPERLAEARKILEDALPGSVKPKTGKPTKHMVEVWEYQTDGDPIEGVTFEMDDVVSATDDLVGVRRPEDSSAHNCNSHGTQRDHWSRPTGGRPGNAR